MKRGQKIVTLFFVGNGFDLCHEIDISFANFVKWVKINKQKEKFANVFSDEKYCKLVHRSKLWSKFEEYCGKAVHSYGLKYAFMKNIGIWFETWIREEKKGLKTPEKNEQIVKILKQWSPHFLVSFNYTDTPRIYGYKTKHYEITSFANEWGNFAKLKDSYITIHFYPKNDKSSGCIIGDDTYDATCKRKFIEKWKGENAKLFDPRKKLFDTITRKDSDINCLVFYGFAFGKSDRFVSGFVKCFLLSDDSRKIVIYVYKNLKSLKIPPLLRKFNSRIHKVILE